MTSKLLFLNTFLLIAIISFAQYPVQVGTHINQDYLNLPYNCQYEYNWSTTIYPKELTNEVHGDIVKISYELNSSEISYVLTQNQSVYMATTSDIEFTNAGYPDLTSMTLVYSGNVAYRVVQNMGRLTEIELDNPFHYDGSSNLIVHLENNDGYDYGHAAIHNLPDTSFSNICKHNEQNGSFPETSGSLINYMPVIYLGFGNGIDIGVNDLSTNSILPGINDLSLNFRNYMGDTIISCDINWELNGVPQSTINWIGANYTGQISNDILLLNDYDFTPGTYQIKAWTSNANGGTDELNTNDTLIKTITVADYIEIADDTYTGNNGYYIPFLQNTWQGWSSSIISKDSIYLDSKICGLSYNVLNNGNLRNNQSLYLSHTTDNFHQTNAMPNETSMTNMFSGAIDYSGTGWKKIHFDNIYEFNNTENIQIYYTDKSNQWLSPPTAFKASVYNGNVGLYKNNNNSQEFPTDNGDFTSRLPNIRLYVLIPIDAGVTEIETQNYVNVGSNDIKISLKNFGTDTLVSSEIKYQLDNGAIQTYNWSGSLICYNTEQNITIANESLTYGEHSLKIWTNLPNGLNDYKNENDTLIKTIYATNPLCGNYTVGASPSDYTTLTEAVDSLNSCGISCDVIFDIKAGTYTSQYKIDTIKYATIPYSVTFRSQTGDSTDVVLASDSTDFCINLNGADFINIEHLTFASDSVSQFITIRNSANSINIIGNVFNGSSNVSSGVSSSGSIDTLITISNNYFNNTSISLSASNFASNNSIINNEFLNGQISLHYQSEYLISNNTFNDTTIAAINIDWGQKGIIEKNNILSYNSNPIYIRNNNDTSYFKNNFINASAFFGHDAIRIFGEYLIFVNNTVVSSSTGSEKVFYIPESSNNNTICNNIVINNGLGGIYRLEEWSDTTNNINNNAVYLVNGDFATFNNQDIATFTDWQAINGYDTTSIFSLPNFVSVTDLHSNSYFLDGAGIPVQYVTDDIDGEPRDATNPDIGADEFTSTCSGPLDGLYNIGTTGDYLTINDAVNALYNCGVSANVIFAIKSGTYNEQILLYNEIPGYTSNYSVMFTSQTENYADVIINFEADTISNNYIFKLDNIDNIIIKNITLNPLDTLYATAISYGNTSSNNIFENIVINGTLKSSFISGQEVFASLINKYCITNLPDSFNIINNCKLNNGSYGVYLINELGYTYNSYDKYTLIKNSNFNNQNNSSVYANGSKNLKIESNSFYNSIIDNINTATVYLYGDTSVCVNNRFDVNCLAIHTTSENGLIANNFIAARVGVEGTSSIAYIYNNSINVTEYAISGIQNDIIKNNIIMSSGEACLYNSTTFISSAEIDNNSYYVPNGSVMLIYGYGGAAYNLLELQQTYNQDLNSVYTNPNFVSSVDLHTSNILLNNNAIPLSFITYDIDGDIRDVSTPDIGADEFTNPTFNLNSDTVCVDAQHTISAGIGFDSYTWSTSSDSSAVIVDSTGIGYGSQEYFVTVTTNGDTYTDNATITFSSPIAVVQDWYCLYNTTDSILISAGNATSYNWSTSNDDIQSIWSNESYNYITVTNNNGCSDNGAIRIHKWFSCKANFEMPEDTVICSDDNLTIDANTGSCSDGYGDYFSYLWSTGDTTETILIDSITYGIGIQEISVQIFSIYYPCITYDTVNVEIQECIGINEITENNNILIYPNPTNGKFTIEGANINKIQITDITGKLIHSETANGRTLIELNKHLKNGIYFVKTTTKANVFITKIVVQN